MSGRRTWCLLLVFAVLAGCATSLPVLFAPSGRVDREGSWYYRPDVPSSGRLGIAVAADVDLRWRVEAGALAVEASTPCHPGEMMFRLVEETSETQDTLLNLMPWRGIPGHPASITFLIRPAGGRPLQPGNRLDLFVKAGGAPCR